jgi:hypothetical protein
MNTSKEPTFGNGKICYVELPALDVNQSADFYSKVFGWYIRQREDGSISFDDSVTEVSGTWVTGRKPASDESIIIYIMVANAEKTILSIVNNGGAITQQIGKDFPEVTAHFSDPAGNILGIYQQPWLEEQLGK